MLWTLGRPLQSFEFRAALVKRGALWILAKIDAQVRFGPNAGFDVL